MLRSTSTGFPSKVRVLVAVAFYRISNAFVLCYKGSGAGVWRPGKLILFEVKRDRPFHLVGPWKAAGYCHQIKPPRLWTVNVIFLFFSGCTPYSFHIWVVSNIISNSYYQPTYPHTNRKTSFSKNKNNAQIYWVLIGLNKSKNAKDFPLLLAMVTGSPSISILFTFKKQREHSKQFSVVNFWVPKWIFSTKLPKYSDESVQHEEKLSFMDTHSMLYKLPEVHYMPAVLILLVWMLETFLKTQKLKIPSLNLWFDPWGTDRTLKSAENQRSLWDHKCRKDGWPALWGHMEIALGICFNLQLN